MGSGREESQLTDKGLALWPVVRTLTGWGDQHYAQAGPRRIFRHATDQAPLDEFGFCTRCGHELAKDQMPARLRVLGG